MDRKSLVTTFHLLILFVLVVITVVDFIKVPAGGLPVHWALDGHPDRIWPRTGALLILPALGLVITAIFWVIGRLTSAERLEPGRVVSEAALAMVLGIFCALQVGFLFIGIGSDIDLIRIIGFAVALLAIGIGVLLPGTQPNAIAGIRLPWLLQNARNWRATHRVTGVLMVLGGVGLGIAAFASPDPATLIIGILAALLLPVAAGILFSLIGG
jgi:uncharacterized membrane protein